MNQRTFPEPLSLSIAAVERDTGIGKDTLRIWERRYGFPQPGRDAFGERSYSMEQVEKLRVIKRLLDQGHRPGRIVAQPVETLQRLSQGQASAPQKMAFSGTAPELRNFMSCILGHDAEGLRRKLHQAMVAMGHFRFVTDLVAPLNGMVASLQEASIDVRMLRDPTRGGVAASLNEIARSSGTGMEIVERSIPVPDDVRAACGFLGLDPLYVANEGRLVAFVPEDEAERALDVMHSHPSGAGATRIGSVVAEHPGTVVAKTGIGETRVVDLPLAEQLPRIC